MFRTLRAVIDAIAGCRYHRPLSPAQPQIGCYDWHVTELRLKRIFSPLQVPSPLPHHDHFLDCSTSWKQARSSHYSVQRDLCSRSSRAEQVHHLLKVIARRESKPPSNEFDQLAFPKLFTSLMASTSFAATGTKSLEDETLLSQFQSEH